MAPNVSLELKLSKKVFSLHVKSMLPELGEDIGRAHVHLNEDPSNFYIYIGAPDMVSVKPALSSISKMLMLVSKLDREVI